MKWANTFEIAYGERGLNGVRSVCGDSWTLPYISELPAW